MRMICRDLCSELILFFQRLYHTIIFARILSIARSKCRSVCSTAANEGTIICSKINSPESVLMEEVIMHKF